MNIREATKIKTILGGTIDIQIHENNQFNLLLIDELLTKFISSTLIGAFFNCKYYIPSTIRQQVGEISSVLLMFFSLYQ